MEPANVIELSIESPPVALRPTAVALRSHEIDDTIGVLEGSRALEFGSIEGAERDAYGRLFVLDGQASELRVFADEGAGLEPWQLLGGAGTGPGEFQQPSALSVAPTGPAVVFERSGRAHRFSIQEDGVMYVGTNQFLMTIYDGCTAGNTLALTGAGPDHPGAVHVFDTTNQRVRSFAQLYRTDNASLRLQIQTARVACLRLTGGILLAPLFLPELRRYGPSGELVWWTRLEGLKPIYLAESSDGNVAIGTPEDGYHRTLGVHVEESGGVVILQVGHITREARARGELDEVLTYILSLESGEGALVGRRVSEIRHVDEEGIVFSRTNPFPTLRLARWSRSEP
ncbi:hypothetical protein [Candidatus Palauibacter sp.]|uniref:hypothetical protein n=1 Tax=Candidatus Palauibacter sp. TaxID=3101350 RepID=UPI003CC6771F